MQADEQGGRLTLDRYSQWIEKCSLMEYSFDEHFLSENLPSGKVQNKKYRSKGYVRFDRIAKSHFIDVREFSGDKVTSNDQISRIAESSFLYVSIREQLFEPQKIDELDYSIVSYLDAAKNSSPFEGSLAGHSGNTMLIFGVFTMGSDFILKDICESFRQMPIQSDKQEWQGRKVDRLTGVYKKNRYELWVDPSLDYMPVRISLTCDSSVSRDSIEYFSFDFRVESCCQVGDVSIPDKYAISVDGVEQRRIQNDIKLVPIQESISGNLSQIKCVPHFSDKDFSITFSIPNYSKISMQDALQIKHIWFDGKIEPLTDELALARIRGVKFIPGVGESRFWLIASGIILIVIALVGKIWQYFQNRKKKDDKEDKKEDADA
ncbi:hypothetical protein FACS189419_05930 [Planctomycetales bacterium]|nr:hypothetical protein FACS189419_05930 [Planctomycetales bacterium]